MLSRIINIINQSACKIDIESGVLFCSNYLISDKDCLSFLDENNCFENTIFIEDLNEGEQLNIELSLYGLAKVGYYYSFELFIQKNKYIIPLTCCYIHDLKILSTEKNENIAKYQVLVNFIHSIKHIAKYSFNELEYDNVIIFREDRSIFIPLIYNSNTITSIKNIEKLIAVTDLFNEIASEKKLFFINELIDFLINIQDNQRFTNLIENFDGFYAKSENAYQFYLRDFSYNKLKIEIDSKALEYIKKIQAVINESQTKLIAIPTVFVLAFVTFEYSNPLSVKNIVTIISLFIFAVLIQLFLNNQISTLKLIEDNVTSYKDTFENNDIEKISSKFSLVEKERQKQRIRLYLIEVILWLIPLSLLIIWLFYSKCYTIAYIFVTLVLVTFFIRLFCDKKQINSLISKLTEKMKHLFCKKNRY